MIKEFWLNLPVKDIKRSKVFFTQLGFKLNSQNGNNDSSACLLIGDKNVVVMLFEEPAFKGFTNHEVADTSKGSEILLSISANSKEEVDEIARKVIEAGGTSNHKPSEMKGWMYGSLFVDLDGHRWNVLYMDMSQMKQG
jgi:predicted lactoylglutathione lyase